ncbi:MAG: glycosyltransferase family 4 protein [Planctomycetaceae bacterium]
MPRIAVLFEYPTLLGGERSLLALIEHLRPRFDFVALAPEHGPLADALRKAEIERHPSPLFAPSGQRLPRPLAVSQTLDAVRSLHADLLHANSLAMGRLTGAAAAHLDIPCTAHLRDIIGLSRAAVNDLNRNARLIAVSDATRQFHVAQGVEASKTIVVHNGVDLEHFQPREPCARIRAEWNLPSNAFVALTVGQVGLRKGWDVLAEAAATLASTFPSLHIVFAGERYSEKPETVAYEQSVRDRLAAAMPGRAYFVGYRDDMPALMNAADLLVHPARQEPFGRVLLEAAASGLPIVATNVGGTPEMLEHGVSALLVPPNDAVMLSQAMAMLIDDANLRSRLAAAARRRVTTLFCVEPAAARLAAVWEGA